MGNLIFANETTLFTALLKRCFVQELNEGTVRLSFIFNSEFELPRASLEQIKTREDSNAVSKAFLKAIGDKLGIQEYRPDEVMVEQLSIVLEQKCKKYTEGGRLSNCAVCGDDLDHTQAPRYGTVVPNGRLQQERLRAYESFWERNIRPALDEAEHIYVAGGQITQEQMDGFINRAPARWTDEADIAEQALAQQDVLAELRENLTERREREEE